MKKRMFKPEDVSYLVHLFTEEDYSVQKLSRFFTASPNTVKKVLLQNGIEVQVSKLASNQQFRDWCSKGKSVSEIATFLDVSRGTVTKVFYILGLKVIRNTRISEDLEKNIIKLYSEGNSSHKVATMLGTSKATVMKYVKFNNIPIKEQQFYNKYTFNTKFFDKIDSEASAYFLGLLFADGYNNESAGKVVFGQSEKDKDRVYEFKEHLNATHKVSVEEKAGGRDFYKIVLSSKYFSDQLKTLGCCNKKTFNLVFPNIPESLLHHFIRGYYDGDGSTWKSQGNVHFSITGYYKFLEIIQDLLINGTGVNKTKLTSRRKNDIQEIRYGGINNLKKIKDYLYKDATIYSKRKELLKMT